MEIKTVEAWKLAKQSGWKFAAAKAHEGWPEGKELTESEYDAAVSAATGAVLMTATAQPGQTPVVAGVTPPPFVRVSAK